MFLPKVPDGRIPLSMLPVPANALESRSAPSAFPSIPNLLTLRGGSEVFAPIVKPVSVPVVHRSGIWKQQTMKAYRFPSPLLGAPKVGRSVELSVSLVGEPFQMPDLFKVDSIDERLLPLG